jgi:hypothetical protein
LQAAAAAVEITVVEVVRVDIELLQLHRLL